MNTEQTVRIDTDTLNIGADLRKLGVALQALVSAIDAEFPGTVVEIRSTGRGTEVEGFQDNDSVRAALRVIIERADF